MEELPLFRWSEEQLQKHSFSVDGFVGANSILAPSPSTVVSHGSVVFNEGAVMLWRAIGSTIDLAHVSIPGTFVSQQRRFFFPSLVLSCSISLDFRLMGVCTNAGVVYCIPDFLHLCVSSTYFDVSKFSTKLPLNPTCACFTSTRERFISFVGFESGAISALSFHASSATLLSMIEYETPKTSSGLLSFFSKDTSLVSPIVQLVPNQVFVCAVLANGCVKLVGSNSKCSSATLKVFPNSCASTTTMTCLPISSTGEDNRVSYLFQAFENADDDAVVLHWDKQTLLSSLTVSPALNSNPLVFFDGKIKVERQFLSGVPCPVLPFPCTLGNVYQHLSYLFSPDVVDSLCRTLKNVEDDEDDLTSDQVRDMNEKIRAFFLWNQTALHGVVIPDVLYRTKTLVLCQQGGASLLLASVDESNNEFDQLALPELPASSKIDFTSLERVVMASQLTLPSPLVTSFAQTLLQQHAPSSVHKHDGKQLHGHVMGYMLKSYATVMEEQCQRLLLALCGSSKDKFLCQGVHTRLREARLIRVLVSSPSSLGALQFIDSGVFVGEESQLPPDFSMKHYHKEAESLMSAWARSFFYPASCLTLSEVKRLAFSTFAPLNLSVPTSVAWTLVSRASCDYALLKKLVVESDQSRLFQLLQGFALLNEPDSCVQAKLTFLRCMPYKTEERSCYLRAVAAQFPPTFAMYFLSLIPSSVDKKENSTHLFQTSLLLDDPSMATALLEQQSDASTQVLWTSMLVLEFVQSKRFDVLKRIDFPSRRLLWVAKDALMDVLLHGKPHAIDFCTFQGIYFFFLRHQLVEHAARSAFMMYLRSSGDLEQELNCLSLTLSACALLPQKSFHTEVMILNSVQLIVMSEVEKLYAFVVAKREWMLQRGEVESSTIDKVSAWDLFQRMIQSPYLESEPFCVAVVHLGRRWRFQEGVKSFFGQVKETMAITLLRDYVPPGTERNQLAFIVAARHPQARNLWEERFLTWRCLSQWVRFLSHEQGCWLEAIRCLLSYLDEILRTEVAFGVIDALLDCATQFTLENQYSGHHVRDVRTVDDFHRFSLAGKELKTRVERLLPSM